MLSITIFLSFVHTILAFSPNSSASSSASVDQYQYQDRRSFLSTIAVGTAVGTSAASINPLIALAEDGGEGGDSSKAQMTMFQDSNVGFQIQIPSDWKKSEQKLPDRRRLLLFINNNDEQNESSNKGPEDLMFVAYTPVRDDFTSLSSFGTVEQVSLCTNAYNE